MPRRTTSNDVARMAGVSQSTVSLVLNGRTDIRIPEATRQRVVDAARQLNYTRNVAARALLTGRARRLGVVPVHPHAFIENSSYYGTLTSSFIKGAMRHGQNMLLHCVSHTQWQDLYADILGGSTDGVILIGRDTSDPLTLALLESGFPTVCVSYQPHAPRFHSVDCDNETGGYLAARHLIELGHRRLGSLKPIDTYSWESERHAGIARAVREAGMDVKTLCLFPWQEWHTPMRDIARQFCALDMAQRPTALILRDEFIAENMILALSSVGVRVPDDMALITFNSTPVCERVVPALTAVGQPLADIGLAAVDMLLALVEGREVPPGTQRFPMFLDIRASCGAKTEAAPTTPNGYSEAGGHTNT